MIDKGLQDKVCNEVDKLKDELIGGTLQEFVRIPSVVGEEAKAPNYVEIPSILETAKILAMTVLNWCGYED